jgi:MerR family redox-sensitive transcriptional activator SoxR
MVRSCPARYPPARRLQKGFRERRKVIGVHSELLTIGELGRRSGRSASSIRYYEQIGLLPEPVRISGQRRYADDTVQTLAVIHIAQHAGLSLEQIKAVLAGPDAVAELRRAATAKLPQVAAMIERAALARDWLELAAMCQCRDLEECPLFTERVAGGGLASCGPDPQPVDRKIPRLGPLPGNGTDG